MVFIGPPSGAKHIATKNCVPSTRCRKDKHALRPQKRSSTHNNTTNDTTNDTTNSRSTSWWSTNSRSTSWWWYEFPHARAWMRNAGRRCEPRLCDAPCICLATRRPQEPLKKKASEHTGRPLFEFKPSFKKIKVPIGCSTAPA